MEQKHQEDDDLEALINELLGCDDDDESGLIEQEEFDLEAMLDQISDELEQEEAVEKAIRGAFTDDNTLYPVAVGDCNPPQRVRAEPMLDGVKQLGWGGFLLASKHPEMVLVYDLETYGVEVVPLYDLPELFPTDPSRPEVFWCQDDFEHLKTQKAKTQLVASSREGHRAIPVLIAPTRHRSREHQQTALISVIWWNEGEEEPQTTTSQHGLN